MAESDGSEQIGATLAKFHKENQWAAPFFKWASNRKNDTSKTKVERLMTVTKLDRRDAINLLKKLDEIGCGKFVVGRHGQSSRMEWVYSVRSIGEAALGSKDELEELDDSPDLLEDESSQAEHRLTLGAERVITIKAPQDLSKTEYTRLKRFVEALNPGE